MLSTPVSVVINTFNEEANIANAIASVRYIATEVIVVDMHSDDRTAEIARSLGARVYTHTRERFVEPARYFALSLVSHEWVLLLDADEMVPRRLADYLLAVAVADQTDVVNIPMVNYLFGKPFGHTAWGPRQAKKRRFFRRTMIEFSPVIHVAPKSKTGARELDLDFAPDLALIHFNYLDTAHFVEKLNRYTDIEAETLAAQGARFSVWRLTAAVARTVFERYIYAQGFRDGWEGLLATCLLAWYQVCIWAKLREITRLEGRAGILASYQREADRILAAYSTSTPTAPVVNS